MALVRERRAAALTAKEKVSEQVDSSDSGSEDDGDGYGSPAKPKSGRGLPRRPSVRGRGRGAAARGSARAPRVPKSTGGVASSSAQKTRSGSELSDLTSLSSSASSDGRGAVKRPRPRDSPSPGPSARVGHSAASSVIDLTFDSPRKSDNLDQWRVPVARDLVFTRVDNNGQIVDEGDGQGYWWPAKVTRSFPLQVTLFGGLVSDAGFSGPLELETPSDDNLRSMRDRTQSIRFTRKTFAAKGVARDMCRLFDVAFSEMCRVDRLHEDEEADMPDSIHAVLSTPRTPPPPSPPSRDRKRPRLSPTGSDGLISTLKPRVRSASPDDEEEEEDEDMGPGAIGVARTRTTRFHFPAQVLYRLPAGPKSEAMYKVKFVDESQYDLPRKLFILPHQPEFLTCELGKWVSVHKTTADSEPDLFEIWSTPRSPSPVADLPIDKDTFRELTPQQQFQYLKPVLTAIVNGEYTPAVDRHAAFMKGGKARQGLVKDVALSGDLPPDSVNGLICSLLRWALPCRPGTVTTDSRATEATAVSPPAPDASSPDGDVDIPIAIPPSSPPEAPPSSFPVSEPMEEDEETDLRLPRESAVITAGKQDVHENPAEPNGLLAAKPRSGADAVPPPPRPDQGVSDRLAGCAAYEALADEQKLDYCTNVLLPEAKYQLLLWRHGIRTDPAVHGDEQEKEWHRMAEEKAGERDWVVDVDRLLEMSRKPKSTEPQPTGKQTGGTRSRPRKGRK